jgi:hypothetical protein
MGQSPGRGPEESWGDITKERVAAVRGVPEEGEPPGFWSLGGRALGIGEWEQGLIIQTLGKRRDGVLGKGGEWLRGGGEERSRTTGAAGSGAEVGARRGTGTQQVRPRVEICASECGARWGGN